MGRVRARWRLVLVVLLWASVAWAAGGDPVAWSALDKEGSLHAGTVLGDGSLRVEGTSGRVRVATFDASTVRQPVWSLRGEVRHDVEGVAYLEMWSVFPDGSRFFTRGLSESGPMGSLRGASDWRRFALPFSSDPDKPKPVRVELNVVFEAPGHVDLRPLSLRGHAPGDDPLAMEGAWWGPRGAGWLGGVLGVLLGGLGALVGVLAGRGRARRLMLGIMIVLVTVGVGLLLAGVVAWVVGQGFLVVFPLALAGAIATLVFGPLLLIVRQRFLSLERRRMAAMDG